MLDNTDVLFKFCHILQFDPELVLISAGYDCAIGCPEVKEETNFKLFSL